MDTGSKSFKFKNLKWLLGFIAIIAVIWIALGSTVIITDPYFHYRAPNIKKYYYLLSDERYQNDGIIKNFDYDAIITGTSMADNFKTSEFDDLFGVNSVKVTYAGGTFKETGDNLKRALDANDNLKIVVRSLDMDFFFFDYNDYGDLAQGDYPTYLYDNNFFNDYKYILNKDVIFGRSLEMIIDSKAVGYTPGITSFDDYSNWMGPGFVFGVDSVCEGKIKNYDFVHSYLTEHEARVISRDITRNITDLANDYPDVEFYYFIPPYSAMWWNAQMAVGLTEKQIQAEQYIIEMLLECNNIHLYSFNTNTELTTDLNNYKDIGHYGEWVNTAILKWMKDGTGLITKDNYEQYINEELNFYSTFDYTSMIGQTDYEDDYEASYKLLGE